MATCILHSNYQLFYCLSFMDEAILSFYFNNFSSETFFCWFPSFCTLAFAGAFFTGLTCCVHVVDFIFLQDLCEAYYRLGCQGRNKANYYIGPGKPKTLMEYFSELKLHLEGKSISNLENIISKDNDIFNTDSIKTDLNFSCEFNMEKLLQKWKT